MARVFMNLAKSSLKFFALIFLIFCVILIKTLLLQPSVFLSAKEKLFFTLLTFQHNSRNSHSLKERESSKIMEMSDLRERYEKPFYCERRMEKSGAEGERES
jgi:hypothetical protein